MKDMFRDVIQQVMEVEMDDYFQKYLKAHLDRGARLIYSELSTVGIL